MPVPEGLESSADLILGAGELLVLAAGASHFAHVGLGAEIGRAHV